MPDFNDYTDDYYKVMETTMGRFGLSKSSEFFAYCKAWHLERYLHDFTGRMLDWGCGHGLTAWNVKQSFPEATVDGYDPADEVIEGIPDLFRENSHFYSKVDEINGKYDIVFAAGVVHHVELEDRLKFMAEISHVLKPGGRLFFFEHNANNPLTRKIMDACPFDDDAIPIAPAQLRKLVHDAGFVEDSMDYISFVPPALKMLLPLEKLLGWCPLGMQYIVAASKGAGV